MSPIVFEINEDTIYKDKDCGESYAMFFLVILKQKCRTTGHDVNFCSDLPCRASEIQFSLALLQLSLALENLYV